jgi:hypothetical protein
MDDALFQQLMSRGLSRGGAPRIGTGMTGLPRAQMSPVGAPAQPVAPGPGMGAMAGAPTGIIPGMAGAGASMGAGSIPSTMPPAGMGSATMRTGMMGAGAAGGMGMGGAMGPGGVASPQSTQSTPIPQASTVGTGGNATGADGSAPPPPPSMPVTPPSAPSRVPTQMNRFANAQKIQGAFRNGWQPNPVLLGASLKGG